MIVLTKEAVREIRIMCTMGIDKEVIARGHKISVGTVYRILRDANFKTKEGAICV